MTNFECENQKDFDDALRFALERKDEGRTVIKLHPKDGAWYIPSPIPHDSRITIECNGQDIKTLYYPKFDWPE